MRKLLKIATISGRKLVLRQADGPNVSATEFLNEFGTTDLAIGVYFANICNVLRTVYYYNKINSAIIY